MYWRKRGEFAATAKIDTIIINKELEIEVALIEVSGPNWKVDTTHFIEDRAKLAKNLKVMFRYIMELRDEPYVVFRRSFKVYSFHVYRMS
jgi:hypothetical protein